MYYFAYGSNMLKNRLEERLGLVKDLGLATLQNYQISFNKQSSDGSGKTNIIKEDNNNVFGVVYEVTIEQIHDLDKYEVGYERVTLQVKANNNLSEMETYIAKPNRINNRLLPTKEYLEFLILGAQEHHFPFDYVEMLKSINSLA